MFASKLAKPQAKNSLTPHASALAVRQPGQSRVPGRELSLAPASAQLDCKQGAALDPAIRSRLEPRFGFDFSRIRVHTGPDAARAAAGAGALAYTVGPHIVFGEGRYNPASPSGLRLLAHELAHAVQQGRAAPGQLAVPWRALRSSTPAEERDAERGSMLALAGQKANLVPGCEPALARAGKPHSDEDLGDVIDKFYRHNDHLSAAQLAKIRQSVIKATYNAKTAEVAYAFFDYYSGWFGGKIVLMTPEEETKARAQDRVAETDPGGDTKIRPDVLSFTDEALGALLLHELSHTGQQSNVAGSGDYQEGQSYGIEYFYAERNHDTDRMQKIIRVIAVGSVAVGPQRQALQQLFKISYAVMTVLRKLSVTGSAPELPVKNLGSEDGQVLLAEYVRHFADPSDRLQKIIDYVTANLSSYQTPLLP
jgi:hypothetical protein